MEGLEETQKERILSTACAIYGGALPEGSDALCEPVTAFALADCNRSDVPEEMEFTLAYLLVRALDGGVSSVSRGDTTLAYRDEAARLLSPFRRLGSLKRGDL